MGSFGYSLKGWEKWNYEFLKNIDGTVEYYIIEMKQYQKKTFHVLSYMWVLISYVCMTVNKSHDSSTDNEIEKRRGNGEKSTKGHMRH